MRVKCKTGAASRERGAVAVASVEERKPDKRTSVGSKCMTTLFEGSYMRKMVLIEGLERVEEGAPLSVDRRGAPERSRSKQQQS